MVTALGVTSVLISAIYFFGNQTISEGVLKFVDSVESAQAFFDRFFGEVAQLKASVVSSQATLEETEQRTGQDLGQVAQGLDDALTLVDLVGSNADSLDIGGITGVIKDGNGQRWLAFIAFGACLMAAAGAYLYIRKNTHGPRRCVLCLGTLVSFLSFMVAGVCLMIAVGVADFCSAPNEVLLNLVGSSEGTAGQVASYYINCPPGQPNPLIGDIRNASAALNESLNELDSLPIDPNEVADLRNALITTNTASDAVAAASGCGELNAAYVGAVKSLCDPSLTGLFCALVVVALIAMMLTLAAVVTLRRGSPQEAYERLDNTPLFKYGPCSVLMSPGLLLTELLRRDRKYGRSDPLVDSSFDDPARSPYYGSTSQQKPRRKIGVRVEG